MGERYYYRPGESLKIKLTLLFGLFSYLATSLIPAGAKAQNVQNNFESFYVSAAREFNVPVWVLKSIAWTETRGRHEIPTDDHEHGPAAYGVMGLRNDITLGHSLTQAAALLKLDPKVLRQSPKQNIRGAAALLSRFRNLSFRPEFESTDAAVRAKAWIGPMLELSGISDSEGIHDQESALIKLLNDGVAGNEFNGHFDLPRVAELNAEGTKPDYPLATLDLSPNFTPRALDLRFVVIHTTQGSFAGAVSHLKNPAANVSAHYVIRSSDGYIKQLVTHQDKAWHARCWNSAAIGIEHEGFIDNPAWYTEAMYEASARLVAFITSRYGIPVSSKFVFGHDFWSKPEFPGSPVSEIGNCNDHTDPGIHWDWVKYLSYIKSSSLP